MRFGGRAEVLRRIDREWAALRVDGSAPARCRRWADAAAVLHGCGDPDAVLARVTTDPDAVLGRLLGWYAAGDELAGRVVLQALLPKLVLMSSRDPAAPVDEYLTALWCAIAAYPLDRRPTSVAANLALDTLKAVRRDRRPAADVTTAPEVVLAAADRQRARVVAGTPETEGPTAAAVLARARRHRLVDPLTGDLLRSVYADGLTGAAAAERYGLTPGAVRTRCSRALRHLARHADLLAEPA